jgi:hypothetical protein
MADLKDPMAAFKAIDDQRKRIGPVTNYMEGQPVTLEPDKGEER